MDWVKAFFWLLVVVGPILIYAGRESVLGWILLGGFALIVSVAAAPLIWKALNEERPNSVLVAGGVAIVVGLILKFLP